MRKLKPEIKSLSILHTTMLVLQVLFLAIVYSTTHNKTYSENDQLFKILQTVAVLATIAGVGLGLFLFSKKMKALQMMDGLKLEEKINQYKVALILKLALIEGPCILSIIGLLLTGNISFLILAVAIILFFALQKPTVMAMTVLLRVSSDDLYE